MSDGVDRASGQILGAQLSARLADGEDLGVGGGVVSLSDPVGGFGEDVAVLDTMMVANGSPPSATFVRAISMVRCAKSMRIGRIDVSRPALGELGSLGLPPSVPGQFLARLDASDAR